MQKTYIILLVLVVGSLAASYYDVAISQQRPTVAVAKPLVTKKSLTRSMVISQPVPQIKMKTINGKTISFADFNNKVVVLNFWASWCVPCVHEFPSMLRLMKKFDGKVEFVAISSDIREKHVEQFLAKLAKDMPKEMKSKNLHVVWDGKRKISQDRFQVVRLPETIIIAPDGRMVRKVVGGDLQWDGDKMMAYIAMLLGE